MLDSKYFIYCSFAGCTLDSTAIIYKDRSLHNKNTLLVQSRFFRGPERIKLGESICESPYPSKEYHKRLQKLDEQSFSFGNLKDVHSKNVYRQCSSEFRTSQCSDKDIYKSIKIDIEKYKVELNKRKLVEGFILLFRAIRACYVDRARHRAISSNVVFPCIHRRRNWLISF